MKFKVLPARSSPPTSSSDTAYLITDNWNDWGKYRTQYHLAYVDKGGTTHVIGDIKIGEAGLTPVIERPRIPAEFPALDEQFFSVGQDDRYYENLNQLGEKTRTAVLKALRDMAADPAIFQRVREEDVTKESLLRSVTVAAVERQFRRIAGGGVRLTKYRFNYSLPTSQVAEPLSLEFKVAPESHPPTNIHVIIGRNGVGKTTLLHNMTRSLLAEKPDPTTLGEFEHSEGLFMGPAPFANLVSVSFSAFDAFEPIPDKKGGSGTITYSYVGLKTAPGQGAKDGRPKSPEMLGEEFVGSISNCLAGTRAKRERWQKAMRTLESDPIFEHAEVVALADANSAVLESQATELFKHLSSGHKIVLLSITKLIEVVEECTLVLLDEPEAHLHPPLLAAMVRAISDLLFDRNGVAIIATHSPVVLQEVPAICSWKLFRVGKSVRAERPEQETFGENVGTLTRDVFGLEVLHSGFHHMLVEAVKNYGTYEEVLSAFDGRLGAEARAIVRALFASKK